MATNSVFFTVRAPGVLDAVGWEVRVLDYKDFTTPVAAISEFSELTVSPQLNDSGAGSITLDVDSPFWSTILLNGRPATDLKEYEYLIEAYQDGILRFQFLATNTDEQIVDEGATRQITISGPGIGHVLTWACIMPKYFPPATDALPAPNSTENAYVGFPVQWSAMRIWLACLELAKARGTIRFVTPMFTESTDSGGAPWEVVQTVEAVAAPNEPYRPTPGTNLLDLLNKHTGQDLTEYFAERTEWFMWPGFKLDVRKVIGVHREALVVFYEGQLYSKERTRARDDIANYVVSVDVYGHTSFSADPASIARWNQREQLQNNNTNVTDPARRTAIGQVTLAQHKDEKSQWTIQVPYDEPGRKVFVDYDIGDWIGISTYSPDTTSTIEAYRVLAITVKCDADTLNPTLELTLESIYDLALRELQKQLTTIINKPNTGDTLLPPVSDQIPVDGYDVGWSPTDGWYATPYDVSGIAGDGTGGGNRVFIQPTDPTLNQAVQIGDFWLQTWV